MIRLRTETGDVPLTWEEWEDRVRNGRVAPEALVQIEAITKTAFVRAGDLEVYRSLRNDPRRAWERKLARGGPPIVTALLVGLQIRIWWFQWVPGWNIRFLETGANYAPAILEDGQVWRLLTSALLHMDVLHLALNMLWLAYTAFHLERGLGRRNVATVFFVSAFVGAVLSAFGSPYKPSVGASGGVFGLIAASVLFGLLHPELLRERGRRVFGWALLPYLFLMFASGFSDENTDNWAHTGGLVTGAILGVLLDPESVQRRPRWNHRVRLWLAMLGLAAFDALAAAGPRLHPLVSPEIASRAGRDAEADETVPASPVTAIESLSFRVPVGWEPETTSAGDVGFGSPLGPRRWSVRERRLDGRASLADLARRWEESLGRAFDDVRVGPLETARVAGREGVRLHARVPDRELVWQATARGIYVLEEVWEVDAARAQRLEPLHVRLERVVTWEDPIPLARARDELAANPTSVRAEAAYANALTEVGDVATALPLWKEILAKRPADANYWISLMRLAQWYPEAAVDRDALMDEALAAHPEPSVILEVVALLEATDRGFVARGLLDAGFTLLPGDKRLARARRARHLGAELDSKTHMPVGLVFDPVEARARTPVEIAERTSTEGLSLSVARVAAERLTREEAALREQVRVARDTVAFENALVRIKHGRVPADREAAVAGVREDLATLSSGGEVPWVDEELALILARHTAPRP